MPDKYGAYTTIREAESVLNEAILDVEADNPGASHEGYGDIVRCVAENCRPSVAKELYRRTGVWPG